MPNHCFNYVRIKVPEENEEIYKILKERPFVPESYFDPPQPNGTNDQILMEWRENNFGTNRFWANYMEARAPTLNPQKESLAVIFQTAWAPPIKFYKQLFALYPMIDIYYEYNEWNMGICGYGSNDSPHNHYVYETKDDYESICKDHDWYMQPFNPHFDNELVHHTINS